MGRKRRSIMKEKWTEQQYEIFKKELLIQAEPAFAEFQAKLLRSELPVIGLRMPFLRKTAQKIAKEGGEDFLQICRRDSYEECLLYGLVAAALPVPYERFLGYCDIYAEEIAENWAHCDVFGASLKRRLKGYEADFFGYIKKYLASRNPWTVRIGLVVMLGHYLTEEYMEETLRRTGAIRSDFYYIRMAQAWLLATAWAKSPEKTKALLETTPLEEWTYRKFVQKACESYRVLPEDKIWLRGSLRERKIQQF